MTSYGGKRSLESVVLGLPQEPPNCMSLPVTDSAPERSVRILVGVALVLLVVFGLRVPLGASLWLDETLSVWVASGSWEETIARAVAHQGQSPLYFLLLREVLALSRDELFLRLLSVAALGGAGAVFYRIARRWFPPAVCILGTALLVSIDHVLVAGLSVRPYSMALLGALGATLALLRWFESGSAARHIYLWAALMVGTFYLHYLFAGLAVVHLVYVGCRWKRLTFAARRSFFAACLVGGLGAVPGLTQLATLAGRAESLSFATTPSWRQLGQSILPLEAVLVVALGLVLAYIVRPYRIRRAALMAPLADRLPLLVWLLGAPVCLFVHAHLAGHSLYVDRWFLWVAPAASLVLIGVVAAIEDARARFITVLVALSFMIFRELERRWHVEDWRSAAGQLAGIAPAEPVLAFTGLVELEEPTILGDREAYAYLSAPLSVYGVTRSMSLLSVNPRDTDHAVYRETVLEPRLASANAVTVVALAKMVPRKGGRIGVPELWEVWLHERGFTERETFAEQPNNQVRVRRYRRPQ